MATHPASKTGHVGEARPILRSRAFRMLAEAAATLEAAILAGEPDPIMQVYSPRHPVVFFVYSCNCRP